MYPIILKLGPFIIRTYGLMLAVAFLIGMYVAHREALKKGVDQNLVYDFALYLLIFGLLGARLYYVIFYEPQILSQNPLRIFALWQGGLAIHGSIITGILVGIWFCKKQKISFWKFADIFAPSLILGEAIGRLGCFSAGCCYGLPSNLPWSVTFNHPKSLAPLGVSLHPTQLYTLFACFLGFLFILKMKKKMKRDGEVILLYLFISSIIRYVIEFYRADSVYIWEGFLSVAQMHSLVALVLSLVLFFKLPRRMHTD